MKGKVTQILNTTHYHINTIYWYPAFDTNFSNQGVRMKIKETDI